MAPSDRNGRTTQHKEAAMTITYSTTEALFAATYDEACDHAQEQYERTGGKYRGGTYLVRFETGRLAEVQLEVRNGLARFVDLTPVEVM